MKMRFTGLAFGFLLSAVNAFAVSCPAGYSSPTGPAVHKYGSGGGIIASKTLAGCQSQIGAAAAGAIALCSSEVGKAQDEFSNTCLGPTFKPNFQTTRSCNTPSMLPCTFDATKKLFVAQISDLGLFDAICCSHGANGGHSIGRSGEF